MVGGLEAPMYFLTRLRMADIDSPSIAVITSPTWILSFARLWTAVMTVWFSTYLSRKGAKYRPAQFQ